ncbi:hypothetical protein [Nocardia terpenica]|uniref:DUF1877 family protein n=1 Tax=Nocardia terpenica TaxID=455432 RepID=A0A6G9Z7Z1_9NOCA|nr:hypothetical protein [Nocardia terpenica]QIS21521.1 hypothetical protein F6W96_27485 [Nocardia terpenica]
MSLIVQAFIVEEDGTERDLDPPKPGGNFAGFEKWRTTVWGSAAVQALGAYWFPLLSSGNPFTVPPDAVPELLEECALLRTHLDAIAPQGNQSHTREWYVDGISEHLSNIEAVAEQALRAGGGVYFW